MPIDHIVSLLTAERDKLNAAIQALLPDVGSTGSRTAPSARKPAAMAAEPSSFAPKKRKVSAAARKRMAAAQKARWAAIKGAK
jgi:hypothetical protein